jgi:hypothetical protein
MCHVKLGPSGGGDQFVIYIWGKTKLFIIYVSKDLYFFRGSRGSSGDRSDGQVKGEGEAEKTDLAILGGWLAKGGSAGLSRFFTSFTLSYLGNLVRH